MLIITYGISKRVIGQQYPTKTNVVNILIAFCRLCVTQLGRSFEALSRSVLNLFNTFPDVVLSKYKLIGALIIFMIIDSNSLLSII